MTLSNSHLAYEREFDLLSQALDDPGRGVRVPFPTYADAATYRHRLHYARKIDRARNREVYAPEDPLYGTSMFDSLVCRIKPREGKHYVYIEKNQNATPAESIPEDDHDAIGIPLAAPEESKQLTFESKYRR